MKKLLASVVAALSAWAASAGPGLAWPARQSGVDLGGNLPVADLDVARLSIPGS